jgi:hypothetical protein
MLWILGGVGVVLSALSLRPKPKGTAPLPEPEPGAPTISAVTALQDSYAQGLAENVANAQASQEETAQIYEEATQTGDIRPLLERQRGARLRAAEIRATAARSHPSKG